MEKKLYRSTTHRILAGVCGGLGEYFDIDPWIVRIFFVLIHGAGLLIYILMAILVPESPGKAAPKAEPSVVARPRYGDSQTGQWIGAALIIIGALFLLDTLNTTYLFLPMIHFGDLWWPILIILFGLYFLTRRPR